MEEFEFEKILNQIISADKTPEYEYFSGDGDNDNYRNAKDVAPDTGCRRTTPRGICKAWLKDIKSGTLDAALKDLMGK